MRIGMGYDVHQLVENRKLIIGGIEIPNEIGLVGHSDADVLTHAIMDALLGALALGDIGKHFPDTDMKYKDIDSCELLQNVVELIHSNGYKVGNIDSVIALQSPKIGKYIPQMQEKLAKIMKVEINQVSIKATTTEHLGFVGRSEGASSYSVCLLEKVTK